jgi:hypothetical protein
MFYYKGEPVTVLAVSPLSIKIRAANDEDAPEFWVPSEDVTEKQVNLRDGDFLRYTVDYERAERPWIFTRWYPELAWVIGFAAQHNAYLRHSGQPNEGSSVEDEFEFGQDSNGEKFDVVMPNPNFSDLDKTLDINFIHRGLSARRVSLNKKGFWQLLESLGFQIGRKREQDVHLIEQSIPAEYVADFRAGVRGTVPNFSR